MGYGIQNPDDFQYEYGKFSDKTWPGQTAKGKAKHLQKEAGELVESIHDTTDEERRDIETMGNAFLKNKKAPPQTGDIEEFADVYLLLMDTARACGFDMSDVISAARDKAEKNALRDWGPLNAEGFSEHTKEAPVFIIETGEATYTPDPRSDTIPPCLAEEDEQC